MTVPRYETVNGVTRRQRNGVEQVAKRPGQWQTSQHTQRRCGTGVGPPVFDEDESIEFFERQAVLPQ